jgi:general secretion pathway protein I
MHFSVPKPTSPRAGLSLLEVILAIAILGVSLATLGQLIRIGARNAAEARDLTMAQLYAESQMNRLSAGVDLLDPVQESGYDDAGNYVYSVDVWATDLPGIMSVTVTVKQTPGTAIFPVSYSLTRWIAEPEYAQSLADAEAAMKQAFADAQAAAQTASGSADAAAATSADSTAVASALAGQAGGGQDGKGGRGDKGGKDGEGKGGRGGKDGGPRDGKVIKGDGPKVNPDRPPPDKIRPPGPPRPM